MKHILGLVVKLVFVSVNWKHFDTISANYLSMVWHNISVQHFTVNPLEVDIRVREAEGLCFLAWGVLLVAPLGLCSAG